MMVMMHRFLPFLWFSILHHTFCVHCFFFLQLFLLFLMIAHYLLPHVYGNMLAVVLNDVSTVKYFRSLLGKLAFGKGAHQLTSHPCATMPLRLQNRM